MSHFMWATRILAMAFGQLFLFIVKIIIVFRISLFFFLLLFIYLFIFFCMKGLAKEYRKSGWLAGGPKGPSLSANSSFLYGRFLLCVRVLLLFFFAFFAFSFCIVVNCYVF